MGCVDVFNDIVILVTSGGSLADYGYCPFKASSSVTSAFVDCRGSNNDLPGSHQRANVGRTGFPVRDSTRVTTRGSIDGADNVDTSRVLDRSCGHRGLGRGREPGFFGVGREISLILDIGVSV